jgi:hypothetical protein
MLAGQINAQILVVGNSRAENGFDPRIIQDITGKKTFNLAWPGSGLPLQLAFLKTYLRHNQKPKYLIQEVNVRSLQNGSNQLYETASLLLLVHEPDLFGALAAIDPAFVRHRYVPLSGVNATKGVDVAVRGLLGRERREELFEGFMPIDQEWSKELGIFKREHPYGIEYGTDGPGRGALKQTLDLCRQLHIGVVLVCTPEYCERQALVRNRALVFDIIKRTASDFGIQFWDYSADPLCRSTNWFWNSIHLNHRGATEFSKRIGQRLREHIASSETAAAP